MRARARTLAALRANAKNWLPELFNAFVAAPAGRRAALAGAVSAYAAVADAETLSRFFRGVLAKLLKVRWLGVVLGLGLG